MSAIDATKLRFFFIYMYLLFVNDYPQSDQSGSYSPESTVAEAQARQWGYICITVL
jgi:hypothetical protein